jgi:hypothetical protein
MPAIDIASDAIAKVTMTGAELNKIVADATAQALRAAGFAVRKAKPLPPRIGYSIEEAVSVSGLGRTTIYGAIRRRELRALKKGSRTIVLDHDLRRWLEGLPPSHV